MLRGTKITYGQVVKINFNFRHFPGVGEDDPIQKKTFPTSQSILKLLKRKAETFALNNLYHEAEKNSYTILAVVVV